MVRAARLMASRWDVAMLIVRSHLTRRKVVIFYSHQSGHRQTHQEIIASLAGSARDDITVIVMNRLNPKDRKDTPAQPRTTEIDDVPLQFLRLFRAEVVFTPFVGHRREDAPRGAVIVHPLVSLTSLDGVYEPQHFDDCDYVLCAGEHQVVSFREWSRDRPQWSGKILIRGGYPKLDLSLKSAAGKEGGDDGDTIVYAPTHVYPVNESLASLRRYGAQIVRALLSEGHRVIFRPHPVSFSDEDADLVAGIVKEHESNPRFILDRSENYVATYSMASLMVTDLSGTGFTFAFTFGRPAIFFSADVRAEEGLRGIQFECREKIGGVARTTEGLTGMVRRLLATANETKADIAAYRDATVFHLSASGRYIAERIDAIMARQTCQDWETL